MIAFLVNSREKIKVNRDGGDRQWPRWFLGVEKWDSMMRAGCECARTCKQSGGEALDAALEGAVAGIFLSFSKYFSCGTIDFRETGG